MFFPQKKATLKTPENQSNSKQLPSSNIESKENQNTNAPRYAHNEEKGNQKEKQEEDISRKANKDIAMARSLYSRHSNPPNTIAADEHKNDKPKVERNGKCTFVIGDSMIKLKANCKVFVKTFSGAKTK